MASRQKHISPPRHALAPNHVMRLQSCRRFTLTRFKRCKNQGVWVSGREEKRTAKISVNFSTAALPAHNLGALGRTLDVQSYGEACLVRRRRCDRVRTNFCEGPPFAKCRVFTKPLQLRCAHELRDALLRFAHQAGLRSEPEYPKLLDRKDGRPSRSMPADPVVIFCDRHTRAVEQHSHRILLAILDTQVDDQRLRGA